MIQLFTGFDPRESDGWLVFVRSLLEHCPDPVKIIPLCGKQRDGSNAFTYERFRIPEYCGWGGWAIWMDGADMLLRADLKQLAALLDPTKAVQVVKHQYRTKHARKYVGTAMESENRDYPCKNWSSMVIWNCGNFAHFKARQKIRQAIDEGDGEYLHRFGWLSENLIGELPIEWNWLADEYGENKNAKLLHWTAGMPGFPRYANAPHADEWHKTAKTLHSER